MSRPTTTCNGVSRRSFRLVFLFPFAVSLIQSVGQIDPVGLLWQATVSYATMRILLINGFPLKRSSCLERYVVLF